MKNDLDQMVYTRAFVGATILFVYFSKILRIHCLN